jgi:hypothetical protein
MKQEYKALGSFGTLGLEIVLCILLGLFLGRWLDGKLGTEPYVSVVGFLFGLAAAVKAIVRTWKEMQKETAREEREQGNPAPMYETKPEEGQNTGRVNSRKQRDTPREHDDDHA